jgi:hypothetical protein
MIGKRLKGIGTIYRREHRTKHGWVRSKVWWIMFSHKGRRFRKSAGTESRSKAIEFLKEQVAFAPEMSAYQDSAEMAETMIRDKRGKAHEYWIGYREAMIDAQQDREPRQDIPSQSDIDSPDLRAARRLGYDAGLKRVSWIMINAQRGRDQQQDDPSGGG